MTDKDEEERQKKIQKERERIAMLSCKPIKISKFSFNKYLNLFLYILR